MDAVLLCVVCVSNVACLFFGAIIGQKLSKGDTLKVPNPVEIVREHKEAGERRQEQAALETMLHNIDVYDGTGIGQREIGRR